MFWSQTSFFLKKSILTPGIWGWKMLRCQKEIFRWCMLKWDNFCQFYFYKLQPNIHKNKLTNLQMIMHSYSMLRKSDQEELCEMSSYTEKKLTPSKYYCLQHRFWRLASERKNRSIQDPQQTIKGVEGSHHPLCKPLSHFWGGPLGPLGQRKETV